MVDVVLHISFTVSSQTTTQTSKARLIPHSQEIYRTFLYQIRNDLKENPAEIIENPSRAVLYHAFNQPLIITPKKRIHHHQKE